MARILLGVSGGIAAYKSLELARLEAREVGDVPGHPAKLRVPSAGTLGRRHPDRQPVVRDHGFRVGAVEVLRRAQRRGVQRRRGNPEVALLDARIREHPADRAQGLDLDSLELDQLPRLAADDRVLRARGREIGRVYFTLESVPAAPRVMHAELD